MGRWTLQILADQARERLDPRRYIHVLGVVHAATALAMRFRLDPEQAAFAAFLHDYSKSLRPEEIAADLRRRGRPLAPEDEPYPHLWHGPHAAALVREECGLGEADGAAEIEQAVALHSTADADMGRLAKAIFLADALEPTRHFEGIDELRALARKDMDEAFAATLARKCRALEAKGRPVSPRAQRALSQYAKGEPQIARD